MNYRAIFILWVACFSVVKAENYDEDREVRRYLNERFDPSQESEYKKFQRKKRSNEPWLLPRRSREVALTNPNLESGSFLEGQSSASDFQIRVGVLSGVSYLSLKDAPPAEHASQANHNFLLGGLLDLQAYEYLRLDTEFFYGVAPSERIDTSDQKPFERSLQHSGVMAQVEGQYPLAYWTPRVGLGYGALALAERQVTLLDQKQNARSTLTHGLYASVGAGIYPFEWMEAFIDYSRSLVASGFSESVSVAVLHDTNPEKIDFDRFRLGTLFHVYDGIKVGTQYTRRRVSPTVATKEGSLSFSEILNQISALALFDL